MRISSFRKVCPNPKLLELMAEVRTKDKVRSKAFVRKLLDVNQSQEDQEALFRVFLGCVYDSRESKEKDSAKRLFRTFSAEFENMTEQERRQFPDTFHKEIQKVASVFTRSTTSLDGKFENDTFTLKSLPKVISKLKHAHCKLAVKQEVNVNKYSFKHEVIRAGIEEFQQLNDTSFPHSVIQLDNSPKMVIIGCPRKDREDSLNRFFSIMIEEKVDVIVALNTSADWEYAISYYEPEYMNAVHIEGYSIACTNSVLLYEGNIAANMPLKVQKILGDSPRSKREAILKSEEFEQYRPRVVERTFVLTEKKTGKTKKITQLHYKNWPDRQASPDLEGWWILLKRQLELQNGPIAIHCQGGIGRTNAHAILTCLISEINALKNAGSDLAKAKLNVPLTMLRLKEQAPRLGGLVSGERFVQIYEMLYRYYTSIEQNSAEE